MTPLSQEQLARAVASAEKRFAALQEKYPEIAGYLVLFKGGRQTGIRSSGGEILSAIPDMVLDDSAKSSLKAHFKKKPKKDAKESAQKAWQEELHLLEKKLNYNPEGRIELRFPNLDYTIIDQLRTDPLVDQTLTPQTRASIRIVLGCLGDLHRSG